MTRKEIEKRCREEMQQNIPDKDALWQKIESQLPEQKTMIQPEKPVIKMHTFYRVMAGAACFMFVLAGASLVKLGTNKTEMMKAPASDSSTAIQMGDEAYEDNADDGDDSADNVADEIAPAENSASASQSADNAKSDTADSVTAEYTEGMKKYSDLEFHDEYNSFPDNDDINTTPLSADGQYFNEEDVLKKSQVFVEVLITEHSQLTTGEILYTAKVNDVYGAEKIREKLWKEETLTILTKSPYLLVNGHDYVLPLYLNEDSDNWNLSYECAPQIELTKDLQVIYHNGWYTITEGADEYEDGAEPLLYDSIGVDDFFYDRMYLTGYKALVELYTKFDEMQA